MLKRIGLLGLMVLSMHGSDKKLAYCSILEEKQSRPLVVLGSYPLPCIMSTAQIMKAKKELSEQLMRSAQKLKGDEISFKQHLKDIGDCCDQQMGLSLKLLELEVAILKNR